MLNTLVCASTPSPSGLQFSQQINGVSGSALQNIQDRFHLVLEEQEPLDLQDIQNFFDDSSENIKKALQPFGYFKPIIHARLLHQNGAYIAQYQIDPGPPLRLSSVQIEVVGEGANNLKIKDFIDHFPLKKGDILKTKKYNLAKQDFYAIAHNQGYLDANLSQHLIKVDLKKYSAMLYLKLNTGRRYYFGAVEFQQNQFAEAFLRRYMPFQTGSYYSSDKLTQMQNNLGQTVYFKSVRVEPLRDQAQNNQIPVLVRLEPKKSQLYTLGLGYGTDTGPRTSLGYELRHITPWGDYFQAVAQLSEIQQTFQAQYVIPGRDPLKQHYAILAGISTNQPGSGQYVLFQTGMNYVTELLGFQQIASLTYQHEQFKVESGEPYQVTQYIVPAISWERIRADDRVNTSEGYRLYLNIEGGEALNQQNRFLQGEFQGKYIHSFGSRQRIIFRTDLGATTTQHIDELPLSIRFYAGGASSVRGFSYQSLGPGRYLVDGSSEYQFKIYHKWYGAAFYDVGNAFDNPPMNLSQSTGLGVVWRSPLGPLELTVSRALNDPNPKFLKGLRVQFVMGPDL